MTSYAEIRNRELEHIEESIRSDSAFKGRLTRIYNKAEKDIVRDITNDFEGFAYREGVSMSEARKIANKTDVQAFQDTARQYVKEKNFSPRANRELRAYNVTMRTNRLELLQARINLTLVELGHEEERLLTSHLSKEFIEEYERQAGILGATVPSTKQMESLFRATMLADVGGASFSDRVWTNQAELRGRLNNTIQRVIIQGENPRVSARELRHLVNEEFVGKMGDGGAKFAADRIAITESARAQTIAQREIFKDNDIEKFIFISETDDRTCEDCEELDGEIFTVDELQEFNNAPPIHPFCRCSIAGYVEGGV